MRSWFVLALGAAALLGSARFGAVQASSDSELRFVRDGKTVSALDRTKLESKCEVRTIEVDDPYYGERKRFRACPLEQVLTIGFGVGTKELEGEDFLLRARDGYVKPATGNQLLEPGGYLVLADADHAKGDDPGFQPIDRRQVDPGPFYMVWTGTGQNDPNAHPWPYQLVVIEEADLSSQYPHVVPSTAPSGSAAQAGFRIFKNECIACHSINGEGGKVGPDLNVPRSIVEYRPIAQIKEYIRNPQTFRYTSMPAHPDLTDAQLDQLVAYFEIMKTLKRDPGRAS